jgi:transcriptional regulator GlxA family with amidase domain
MKYARRTSSMGLFVNGRNDIVPTFSAMSRRLVVLVFPDFQLLDAAGPIAAFEIAERTQPGAYQTRVRAAQAGLVRSSAGVELQASALGAARGVHTLLVAGGDGTRAAMTCKRTLRFIQACARGGARVASVCSGTYLLAAAGLLNGKCATTHWSRTHDFRRRFARVQLEPDRIFVQSGKIWTSAGISAGIDLALALIAEDLGETCARHTAQQLVVYYRRPGGQSQFSALLELEAPEQRFSALMDHIRSRLQQPLTVAALARHVGMSPRNFSRAFHAQMGHPPAKVVERLRLEAARSALESGADSIQRVAERCGFGQPERMRRAFLRYYGLPPASIKRQRPAMATRA